MKLITVATSLGNDGLNQLYNSAKKNGWDIETLKARINTILATISKL